jgi:hypothetical protein
MKLLITASLALAGLVALPAEAHPHGYGHGRGIETRQTRQDARIAAGWHQGQLTPCEAARLSHRANRIERREGYYRGTAGLQPWERRDLNLRLDGLSRDIREQRRDGNGCY